MRTTVTTDHDAARIHHELAPLTAPIRRALDAHGIIHSHDEIIRDGACLSLTFAHSATDTFINLQCDVAPRTPIIAYISHANGRNHAMTLDTDTPAEGVAAIIAAATASLAPMANA